MDIFDRYRYELYSASAEIISFSGCAVYLLTEQQQQQQQEQRKSGIFEVTAREKCSI